MQKRNFLIYLIVLALIISLTTGCSKKNPDDSQATNPKEKTNLTGPGELPIVKDKITLSVYTVLVPDQHCTDYEENDFTKWLEEKTNIKLKFEVVPTGEEALNRLMLLLTTGEYPDILFSHGFSPLEQDIYGSNGILLPLNDYIEEYGVETKKMFEMFPEVKNALVRKNGNIYCLPQIVDPKNGNSPCKLWVYTPFLEALDKEMPTNTDEFYDLLKAIKSGDPNGNGLSDEVPLAGSAAWISWSPKTYLMNAFIYDDNDNRLILNNGKLEPIFTKSEYKEGLKYIEKLYREGLIIPETFTQTFEQLQELLNRPSHVVGVLPSHAPFIATTDRFADYKVLPPIKGPGGIGGYASTYYSTKDSGPVITNNCKNPEAAFRLLDFFYTEEASISVVNGIRGIDWDYNDDQSFINDLGNVSKYKSLTNEGRTNHRWPMITNFYRGTDLVLYWYNYTDEALEALGISGSNRSSLLKGFRMMSDAQSEVYANYIPPNEIRVPQVILFTEDEAIEVADIKDTIYGYVNSTEMQFIMGMIDIDAEWDDYIKQLEHMGLERLMEITQAAYDRQYK